MDVSQRGAFYAPKLPYRFIKRFKKRRFRLCRWVAPVKSRGEVEGRRFELPSCGRRASLKLTAQLLG